MKTFINNSVISFDEVADMSDTVTNKSNGKKQNIKFIFAFCTVFYQ